MLHRRDPNGNEKMANLQEAFPPPGDGVGDISAGFPQPLNARQAMDVGLCRLNLAAELGKVCGVATCHLWPFPEKKNGPG
jgi:hypothetical protein